MSAKDRARTRARLAAQLRRRRLRCVACGARAEVDQRGDAVWVDIQHAVGCPGIGDLINNLPTTRQSPKNPVYGSGDLARGSGDGA